MIMTQNEKELLVKDITARLPYRVKIKTDYFQTATLISIRKNISLNSGKDLSITYDISGKDEPFQMEERWGTPISEIKPYLFPFSSMTEKQKDEIRNRFCYEWESDEDVSDLWKHELEFGYALEFIQWCYENHLDIGGLIPKGLAIDATNKNIY